MSDDRPTFGSLFAGIGGIDLGLERAGWRGRWQVEYEPFCQRVLAKHWPDVQRYGDIHDVDWSLVEPVDLVAGGFPCQPFSYAGARRLVDDDRWLWPEFARCLRALRPRYVLVENVPGLLVGGGMDDVLGGLAELGYDTEWESLPAEAVGAPHLRYRVWLIAYANGQGQPGQPLDASARSRVMVPLAHTNGIGSGRTPEVGQAGLAGVRQGQARTEPDGPGSGDRPIDRSGWWTTEPDVGRVAHGVPARVDRLRSLGNAVVPQVVEFIGRRILEADSTGSFQEMIETMPLEKLADWEALA